jgi:3'(2'), 5'-bisphosphate nucleotidase
MVVREVKRLRGDATEADVLDWIDFGGEVAYSDRFWTLDPIDGTKGFLRGDQYAIALALIENGRVVVAAVCCPNLEIPQTNQRPGVVLSAQAGQGTLIYSLDDMALVGRARVSDRGDPAMIRMCESVEAKHTSHSAAGRISEILGIRADPVRLDSQAKYAVVASGNADVYLRLPSGRRYVENIWDHAGGALLVEEAGGVVSDVSGRPLDFSRGYKLSENRGIVVSNGHVHDRLLQAVSEAGVS